MHVACYMGHASLLELLENAEIDVDAVDRFGLTALHLAAMYGHADCCAELLALGASPCIRDARGQTPLHKAAYRARLAVLDILAPHCSADCVGQADNFGRTALHVACMQENGDCLRRLLVLAPSLVTVADNQGNTLAHYAARYDLVEVLTLLAELSLDMTRLVIRVCVLCVLSFLSAQSA